MGIRRKVIKVLDKASDIIRSPFKNVGPAIQRDNYGAGTTTGGTTYKETGTSTTTTGTGGTSETGGSSGRISRGGGSSSNSQPPQSIQQALQQSGLSQGQSEALVRSEQIRRIAEQRKRGFTRLEAQRYLGGGQGVRNLRQGTQALRRAGVQGSSYVRNLYDEALERERPQAQQYKYQGTIERYERPKQGYVSEKTRLADIQAFFRDEKFKGRGKDKTFSLETRQTGIAILSAVADSAGALVDLPETGYRILKNPKILLQLPKILLQLPKIVSQEGKNFGYVAKTNPGEAVGYIGGNLVSIYGTTKAIDLISKGTRNTFTRLSSKYVGNLKTGDKVRIPVGGGKKVTLEVVGSIPKSTIKNQLAQAGKQIDFAVSSQSQKLLGLIRRGRTIRKPIAGEEGFNRQTRRLLKQFDRGTITIKNIIKLDRLVKKQGAKGLLERSFFASSGGEIRPSRLGIVDEGDASFTDYLTEDITFRRNKPQVLVFRNLKIQDFPKSLKGIVKKIKAGKQLAQAESGRLLQYQLTKSGKFKPLGFISGEKEITLAPGELVKRQKVIGRAIIKGRSVPIIQAKVVRSTPQIRKLLKKVEKGTAKPKDVRRLNKALKRKTGFDYDLSSKTRGRRFVDVRGSLASASSRTSRLLKRYSYKGKYISSSKYESLGSSGKSNVKIIKYSPRGGSGKSPPKSPVYSPPKSPPKSPVYSPPKSPPKRGFIAPPKSPPKRGFIAPPVLLKRFRFGSSSKTRKLSKAIRSYNVYAKSGRKFVKINKGALSRQDALNRGSFAIDNTTARTFKIVRAGKRKTIYGIPQQEKNYYQRSSHKLREYRIKRGRKFGIVPKYIEKRRYGIDTRGEKRGLSINRYLKGFGKGGAGYVRKRHIKISAQRRKQLIKQLVKARRVLQRRRR